MDAVIRKIQATLQAHYHTGHWWPAETQDEMVMGAVLTQGTAWRSVERALSNLKASRITTLTELRRLDRAALQEMIRLAGCFVRKSSTLIELARLLQVYGGSLDAFVEAGSRQETRDRLLAVSGIGPETADVILLYAGGYPVFIVDAYARRILDRHGVDSADAPYDELQCRVESLFPGDPDLFQAFHAGLVETGKKYCLKRRPRCAGCPLGGLLTESGLTRFREGA